MMMLREEEGATKEEIGVLCSGKRFRLNKKRIVVDREEKHSEFEERDTGVILQIIPCTEGSAQSSRRRSHSGQTLCQTHNPLCVSKV
jgi:hypothetical protein